MPVDLAPGDVILRDDGELEFPFRERLGESAGAARALIRIPDFRCRAAQIVRRFDALRRIPRFFLELRVRPALSPPEFPPVVRAHLAGLPLLSCLNGFVL